MRRIAAASLVLLSCSDAGQSKLSPLPADVSAPAEDPPADVSAPAEDPAMPTNTAAMPMPGAGAPSAPDVNVSDAGTSEGPALGYPVGPYGEPNPDVGDVIENLSFIGFSNPEGTGLASAQPYGEFSLSDFRGLGQRYLLILVGSVW